MGIAAVVGDSRVTSSRCVVEGCQGCVSGEAPPLPKLTIEALAAVDVSLKIVWPPPACDPGGPRC